MKRTKVYPVIFINTPDEWEETLDWLREQESLPFALERLEMVLEYQLGRDILNAPKAPHPVSWRPKNSVLLETEQESEGGAAKAHPTHPPTEFLKIRGPSTAKGGGEGKPSSPLPPTERT